MTQPVVALADSLFVVDGPLEMPLLLELLRGLLLMEIDVALGRAIDISPDLVATMKRFFVVWRPMGCA